MKKVAGNRFSERLDHGEAAALVRKAEGEWKDSTYKARSMLFKSVSRIKNPAIKGRVAGR